MQSQNGAPWPGSPLSGARSARGVACVSIDWADQATKRIAVVSDCPAHAGELKLHLADLFHARFLHLDELAGAEPGEFIFVDVNLRDAARVSSLKRWLERRPKHGQAIFAVNRGSRLESIQAYAIGATDVLARPVDGKLLRRKLSGGLISVAPNPAGSEAAGDGISVCVESLQDIFAAAVSAQPPDVEMLNAASAEIVERIDADGLAPWLGVIRKHHSQTFQHCLIVTAVAVSFGRFLGFHAADKQRMASAGLLHDLGKARIPVDILEKPTPLCEREIDVMRAHPELGFAALRDAPGLHPEMLDVVLHHHEYLDGSGYPHGLQANEIPDLVRTVTIADIYGALIERRPYRAPMSGAQAYQALEDMGPKLDRDLVRAFRCLAQSVP
jgi:putative nucleotidyltransferase with HDIG domain